VSPVKYELGFYIPEDGILHIHCRENLKPYMKKESNDIIGFDPETFRLVELNLAAEMCS
jgi:hypothetical protein